MPAQRKPGSGEYLRCENEKCEFFATCNKVPTAYKDCEPVTSFPCPVCGSPLYWKGSYWRCTRPECVYLTN